jgi:alkanesulfonate monooxygenase SsuD/methylene tetrahydromethanopterin reductase-like flavin-dependent oxidoreductase (luciferase family)
MTDYGHPITFGLSLYPSVDLVDENKALAREADASGLDYVAIQDHAYNPEFLDTWTLITYLAAETERITFVPDVVDLQLRPPTILAKAAASLSVLSRGRNVLGVGGGASPDGIAAMGGPRRTTREMVEFTDEALGIMRLALRGGGVEFRSDQHAVEGYEAGPIPTAPIPLWLGANGKRMLEVTGRSSDGWVSPLSVYVQPTAVPALQHVIDEAARSAGRAPTDVRRIYNVVGAIGPRTGGSG